MILPVAYLKSSDFFEEPGPEDLPLVGWEDPKAGQVLCTLNEQSGMFCGWEATGTQRSHDVEEGPNVLAWSARGRGDHCLVPGDSGSAVCMLSEQGAVLTGIAVATVMHQSWEPLLPQTCDLLYTSVQQVRQQIGGEPLLIPEN